MSSRIHEPKAVSIRRSAPFDQEPGFYEPASLWLYGNAKLLDAPLFMLEKAFGRSDHLPSELDEIEQETERNILESRVLVCGIHSPAHQRAAIVPLRWGTPRIVVFSGGFFHHLGENLAEEPFRAARLWRYSWDPLTDFAVSRRAPEKAPTFAICNPTVDRLIRRIVERDLDGVLFGHEPKSSARIEPVQPSLFPSLTPAPAGARPRR